MKFDLEKATREVEEVKVNRVHYYIECINLIVDSITEEINSMLNEERQKVAWDKFRPLIVRLRKLLL